MKIAMELEQLIDKVETYWCSFASDLEVQQVPADIIYVYNAARVSANENRESGERLALEYCEATLQSVWEQLNIGHWSSIPLAPRKLYSQASLLKCLLLLRKMKYDQVLEGSHHFVIELQAVLSTCDMGLLLGAPLTNNALHEVAQLLSFLKAKQDNTSHLKLDISSEYKLFTKYISDEGLPPALPVLKLKCPAVQTFYTQHFIPRKPVIITDCIEHWPARNRWNAAYLKQVAAGRTVPIELGIHYADDSWSQQLMTIEKFVDQHLLQTASTSNNVSKPLGYLAQHLLFDQIPELRNDIYVPEYCCLRDPNVSGSTLDIQRDEEEEDCSENIEINAWIGPAGTLSPLHYDPKHNILAQVKGYKRVWLFSPGDSSYLYPHKSATLLSNTAQVDPEKTDFDKFPDYMNATAYRCLLSPGDCLYIPPRWWHHVRALSPSMSVSFWWE